MAKFQCNATTQQKVTEFEEADEKWKAAWSAFETQHQAEIDRLEAVREERNSKLDAARHALRADAEGVDISEVKAFRAGLFSVQKKWSSFYIPEKLVANLKDHGLYDSALAHGIVAEKIEVAKYEQVRGFLTNEGLVKEFESCEDGCELTPAISGPKPAAPLGGEKKDR